MIRFASPSMITELKALWLECFPGDDEYCDFFFDHYFSPETCVVHAGEGGEVEAAAYIFRGKVKIAGRTETVLFLYAGATFKKYRKMGKCSAICRWIADYCRENGIGIIALSTSPSSLSLCEKSGMIPMANMASATVVREKITDALSCVKCDYSAFAQMRSAYLSEDFAIDWTEETLRYMHAEMQTSGDIVRCMIGGSTCYAAYTLLEDELLIRETNCPPADMSALVDAVCAYAGWQGKVTVYTKADAEPCLPDAVSRDVFCYAHMWFVDESLAVPGAKWYINLTAE